MTRLSRFEQELSGQLGDFWKKHAEKELEDISKELAEGKITIDEDGIARNFIGRALMSDMMEKLSYVTDAFSVEATRTARDKEVDESIAEYRRNYKGPSEEALAEMRAAFGPGEVVVNVLTGTRIYL